MRLGIAQAGLAQRSIRSVTAEQIALRQTVYIGLDLCLQAFRVIRQSLGVVVDPPDFNDFPSFGEITKDVFVQAFVCCSATCRIGQACRAISDLGYRTLFLRH